MRAVPFSSHGGPEVVTVTSNAPRPSLGEGQVLVDVRAASLDPVDLAVRSGMMKVVLTTSE